jgi:CubicO group peptidase (beta-lactamase class C family)
VDVTFWQDRLDRYARRYDVPAASLAVLHDGKVTALATGVLNLRTGVAATTDSLFQIGSITKVYTATVVLRLLARHGHTVDTPVAEILPDFRVRDPDVSEQVTVGRLLDHTSGIDGDLFLDTGRGDDCVTRYVEACADLPQNHPLGATMSYCNSGYVVLGRIVEQLSGQVWDAALREHLLDPLGVTHTVTLPEDVLRFRAALGHVDEPGRKPEPAPVWGLMRSLGPAGGICATAADVVAFARLHLDGGRDLLPADAVAGMQEPRVRVPDRWTLGSHWGLGWILFDWDGRPVYGHDGNTVGQSAYLRVVPDAGLAVALLTNGGHARALYWDLHRDLLRELAGLGMPPPPEPPARPPDLDLARFAGTYRRVGKRLTFRVSDGGGALVAQSETTDVTGPLAEVLAEPEPEVLYVPFAETEDGAAFLGRAPDAPLWTSAVFYRLPGGTPYVHSGARATPRVGDRVPAEL